MLSKADIEERSTFVRVPGLDGIELRCVENSTEGWCHYSTGFELMLPHTWSGTIWHRERERAVTPGCIVASSPGELVVGQKSKAAGSRLCIALEPSTIERLASCQTVCASDLRLKALSLVSPGLNQCVFDLLQAFRAGERARLSAEAAATALIDRLLEELTEAGGNPPPSASRKHRIAERARQFLHADPTEKVELETLAKATGLSRFQALRAFKRAYGVPPHAYQLSMRLSLAQRALREGGAPARVAVEYGFVDQSHLTRHFKRLLGITPGQYMRSGSLKLASAVG